VVSAIGAGGMGEVYRARDARLNRDVAIKVLPAGLSADKDRLQRFEQEARAAAALNHPGVLGIHDLGSHDGAPFIVSELLEGETLRERLAAGALPVRRAIELGIQIAQALAAAHEKGIVHRDLKPENIFVTKDGRAKILDFGLAKLTQAAGSGLQASGLTGVPTSPALATEVGVVLGTVGYMAPEQVRGLAADHRADLFAFGAVLYEMLSGKAAFRRETNADTMTAILKEEPADLAAAERKISPALSRIVDRCLEKNPSARFQSSSDLSFALAEVSDQSGAIRAAATSRPRPVWARLLLMTAAGGVLAVSAAVLGRASAPFFSRSTTAAAPLVRFHIEPPPDMLFPLGERTPFSVISPDGRQVVFGAVEPGGRTSLWVRGLDATDVRRLQNVSSAAHPFWSPDSRSIAYFAGGNLMRADVSGGVPLLICPAPFGYGGTWNREDTIIFGAIRGGLSRVSAGGGQPVPITTIDPAQESSHRLPQFLPDGRRFLYTSFRARAIYTASLDGSAHSKVLDSHSMGLYSPSGHILFVRSGTLLAQRFDIETLAVTGQPLVVARDVVAGIGTGARAQFSVSNTGVLVYRTSTGPAPTRVAWLGRDGRPLDRPEVEAGDFRQIALSPDERHLAVSRRNVDGGSNIWLIDVARGVLSRFTPGESVEDDFVWAADSRRLVFTRDQRTLVVKGLAGAEEKIVLDRPNQAYGEDWSSDGRWIAFNSLSTISVLPLSPAGKPFPIVDNEFAKDEPRFSPDGRWVVYYSNESGRPEVYAQPFPGPGERVRLSTHGGSQPRWRGDGGELFYLDLGGRIMAVPVKVGTTLDPGAPVPLFQTPIHDVAVNIDQYDVSKDGRRFALLAPVAGAGKTPITVVVNWTAGLKE
jgi:Tol biopolymer transport system component